MSRYTSLDRARNVLTVAAAVVLSVFHRDVSAYLPAAAVLVAGGDLVATNLIKGKGGILHRLEAAVSSLAGALGQAVPILPASAPAVAARDLGEAATVTGELATLATAVPASSVVVNVHPPVPAAVAPDPTAPPVAPSDGSAAGPAAPVSTTT